MRSPKSVVSTSTLFLDETCGAAIPKKILPAQCILSLPVTFLPVANSEWCTAGVQYDGQTRFGTPCGGLRLSQEIPPLNIGPQNGADCEKLSVYFLFQILPSSEQRDNAIPAVRVGESFYE
jgi:hypothetical protein